MKIWFTDVRAITIRNLIRFRTAPDIFAMAVLQPVMFVVLFSQVFGGAIDIPGVGYTNYLMAGIFAQTAVFGSTFTGMFMIQDRKDGLLDRFKTLPMSSSAVLFARTFADILINSISICVMVIAGLVVGWRPEDIGGFIAGVLLLLSFSWAFSWLILWVSLRITSEETFNSAIFMVMFPLTFLSNAFVPTDGMATVLRIFAEWNPVSALVHATRTLFGNTGAMPEPSAWPMQHSLLVSIVGIALFVVIFAPLSTRHFRRR